MQACWNAISAQYLGEMTDSHSGSSVQRLATTAGLFTAVAGTALLGTPERLGPLIGLTGKRDAQLVGALDLALVPGLLFGRPRWPWLAARAASNLVTVGFVLRRGTDDRSRRNARVFSAALALATVTDLRAAYTGARPTTAT